MNNRLLYASILAGLGGIATVIGLLMVLIANTNRSADTGNHVLTLVTEIHNNVTSSQYGLAAIKNVVDTMANQSSFKSILVNNETGHEQIWLPAVPGITYRGHVTLNTADYPICNLPNPNQPTPSGSCFPDPVMVICALPGNRETSTVAIQPASATPVILGQSMINSDFACTSLFEDGVSPTTGIYGVIQYQVVRVSG